MWIFENWDIVVRLCFFALGIIAAIVTFAKSRSVSKSIQKFEEVNDLKFKTLDSNKKQRPNPTTFSEYADCYVLNPATNELEKLPTRENIVQKIESYMECALERALERFEPKNVVEKDDVAEQYADHLSDLADLGAAMEIAEEYRDRLGLPDNLSVAQIYEKVDQEARSLRARLDSFQKKEEKKVESQEKKVEPFV